MNMKKIYRKIAKEYHTSPDEVRREIQFAIDEAWNNPDKTPENIAMQRKMSPDGSIPTAEALIEALSKELAFYK